MVKCNGGGKAFSVEIPAGGLAQAEEGVKVAGGSGADVIRAAAGEGKVKKYQMECFVALIRSHADVIGFDVAVGDAFSFEDDDGFEQVRSETLKKVEIQAAILAESLGEGLFTGAIEQNGGAMVKFQNLVAADKKIVGELLEHFTFIFNALVVVVVDGDFEDKFLLILADQQSGGGGTGAKLAEDLVAAGQDVSSLGVGGVAHELVAGCGQLFFNLVEKREELGGVVEAIIEVRIGAVLDELIERFRRTVDDTADAQAAIGRDVIVGGKI